MSTKPLPRSPSPPTPPTPPFNHGTPQYNPEAEYHGRATGPEIVSIWSQALAAFSRNALLASQRHFLRALQLLEFQWEIVKPDLKPKKTHNATSGKPRERLAHRESLWPAEANDAFLRRVNEQCVARLKFNYGMLMAINGEYHWAGIWFADAAKKDRNMVIAKYARSIALAEMGNWEDAEKCAWKAYITMEGLEVERRMSDGECGADEQSGDRGRANSGYEKIDHVVKKTDESWEEEEYWEVEVVDWVGARSKEMYPRGERMFKSKIWKLKRVEVKNNRLLASLQYRQAKAKRTQKEKEQRGKRILELSRELYDIQKRKDPTNDEHNRSLVISQELRKLAQDKRRQDSIDQSGRAPYGNESSSQGALPFGLNGIPFGTLLPPPHDLLEMYSDHLPAQEDHHRVAGEILNIGDPQPTEGEYFRDSIVTTSSGVESPQKYEPSMDVHSGLDPLGLQGFSMEDQGMLSEDEKDAPSKTRLSAIPMPLNIQKTSSPPPKHPLLEKRIKARQRQRQSPAQSLTMLHNKHDSNSGHVRFSPTPWSQSSPSQDDENARDALRSIRKHKRHHSLLSQAILDDSEDEAAEQDEQEYIKRSETTEDRSLSTLLREHVVPSTTQSKVTPNIQTAPLPNVNKRSPQKSRRRQRSQTATSYFPYARQSPWVPHRVTYDTVGRCLDLYFLLDPDEIEADRLGTDTEDNETDTPLGRFAKDFQYHHHVLDTGQTLRDSIDDGFDYAKVHRSADDVVGLGIDIHSSLKHEMAGGAYERVRLDPKAIRNALHPSAEHSLEPSPETMRSPGPTTRWPERDLSTGRLR